jgi:transcriptional/translational regulatory protein YebC/TACO1
MFSISKEAIGEEALFEAVSEAGAEDLQVEGGAWVVTSAPNEFGVVRDAIEALGVEFEGELTPIPENTVPVSGSDAQSLLKLLDALDDLDDVQNVVANFEIDDSELESLGA